MSQEKIEGVVSEFRAGTILISEGSLTRKMFIIKSGKARVFKTYLDQRITLAILGEGEVFGELSFFDSEPRSASVEALTDLSAVIIDGEKAAKEIAGLPEWIHPLFRTILHRFREADRKITVLQSMQEFQKKPLKTDNMAKLIYQELLRFIKTMRLIYVRDVGDKGFVDESALYKELDEVLGTRSLGLRVFWRLMKEYDFINNEKAEKEKRITLNVKPLGALNDYLQAEVNSENYLFLSQVGIALLGRIVGVTHADQRTPAGQTQKPVIVRFSEIEIQRLPLYKDALTELKAKQVLKIENESFVVEPGVLYRLYTYQSILKAFDHTIISTE